VSKVSATGCVSSDVSDDHLTQRSAATLVHAFVTSCVDQCNAVLAGATKSVTDTLQRVMNAAARVVSDTRKFDHGLTQILHDDLQWPDKADRVTYKLGVIMHRCRHGKASQYLVDCCTMVWNSLPDDLRAQQDYESFRQGLK